MLATAGAVPADCTVLLAANPRTTFLPAESAALRSYLAGGGSALLLFDLGFVPEPGLSRLLSDLGVRLEQQVVVDPLSHYHRDAEMVAVTGYDPHPDHPHPVADLLSRHPAADVDEAGGRRGGDADPPEQPRQLRTAGGARGGAHDRGLLPPRPRCARQVAEVRPRVLGIAAEGTLAPGAPPFRAVVIGDGDFASNSFLPYMANSDLLVAAVRWLAREERGTAVRTRIPVPPMILLTGAQSRWLFVIDRHRCCR